MTQSSIFKLSICIATFNRAAFIGATLDSIIPQMTSDCEIVVSDNASTDDTENVVAEYTRRFDRLRYIRQDTNIGPDRNFDCTVQLARGEYCWLMPDDDLMKPGAVARVLQALRRDLSLIIVNMEFRDVSMSRVLQRSSLDFDSDRFYGRDEMDRLFLEVDEDRIMYIGGMIIKRAIWLARDRERYYDSLFVYVGAIFQAPLPGGALVIAEPLISNRLGNTQSYSSKMIEIVFVTWPSLVESLALSESARRLIPRAEPWRHPLWLLLLRGWGLYSLTEYRCWIRPRLHSTFQKLAPVLVALLPAVLANILLVLYYSARQDRGRWLYSLRISRFHLPNWWALKRSQSGSRCLRQAD